jgi:hypothetical protein
VQENSILKNMVLLETKMTRIVVVVIIIIIITVVALAHKCTCGTLETGVHLYSHNFLLETMLYFNIVPFLT